MKSNELRTGNLINIFGIPEIVTAKLIFNMAQIEKKGKIAIDISPIPLTGEYLLKFGYKHCGYCKYKKGKRVVEYFNGWAQFRTMRCIKYVHDFQNQYFAIYGDELTLKD